MVALLPIKWQLNGNKSDKTITFESWFTQQLTELGVTSLDDLALFDESDFVFNGIPEWELDDFLTKYPQTVILPDLTLSVDYFPQSKRVLLTYRKGGRKGDVKRWEIPPWSGWRIQYQKASRKIDIK